MKDSPDGTPDYFIDGWGQPIRFIRWPAGLVTDIQDCNSTNSPDPLDPLSIDQRLEDNDLSDPTTLLNDTGILFFHLSILPVQIKSAMESKVRPE